MNYLKVSQIAEKWGISSRRVRTLCAEGKIEGVVRKGNLYLIPADAEKPVDRRRKESKDISKTTEQMLDSEFISVNELKKFVSSIDSIKNTIISPPVQNLVATVQNLQSNISSLFYHETVQPILGIGQHLADSISSIVKSFDVLSVSKNLSKAMMPISYIHLLKKLNWPIFLVNDEQLQEDILKACKDSEDINIAKEIIYKYCTEEFLTLMEKDWLNCSILTEDRKPILSQAIFLHNQGYYYASTSMLMCQVYGVAADIENELKEKGLALNQEEKEYVAEIFNLNPDYINNEKGRLFQTLMFTENGMLLWNAMADYLREVCLYSGKEHSAFRNQPLRNKICHGDQLDFGTKEHSLKAILTIDMFIQLAYEINRVIENKNGINDEG